MKTDGTLTPAGKNVLAKPKTKGEREIRAEVIVWLWTFKRLLPDCRKSMERATGLKWGVIEKVIEDHYVTVAGAPSALQMMEEQVELQKVRHEGRVELINSLWDVSVRAIKVLNAKLQTLEPRQAATVAGIAIDKALLLSGQPTSRVARTDERLMSNEELVGKLGKLGAKFEVIQLEIEKSRMSARIGVHRHGGRDVSVRGESDVEDRRPGSGSNGSGG